MKINFTWPIEKNNCKLALNAHHVVFTFWQSNISEENRDLGAADDLAAVVIGFSHIERQPFSIVWLGKSLIKLSFHLYRYHLTPCTSGNCLFAMSLWYISPEEWSQHFTYLTSEVLLLKMVPLGSGEQKSQWLLT